MLYIDIGIFVPVTDSDAGSLAPAFRRHRRMFMQ